MTNLESYRKFLKADTWEDWEHTQSDQGKGIAAPPLQKSYPADAPLLDLIPPADFTVGDMPLREAIARRKSRRRFSDAPMTLEELSFCCGLRRACKKSGAEALPRAAPCPRPVRAIPSRRTCSYTTSPA
jgi:hypothetical protein